MFALKCKSAGFKLNKYAVKSSLGTKFRHYATKNINKFNNQLYLNHWTRRYGLKTSLRYFCTKNDNNLATTQDDDENTNTSKQFEIDLSKVKGRASGDSAAYLMAYTWGVCGHRQARTFTKRAYHKGVVIIRCENCDSLHLIADNLGWFTEENTNIEDIMAQKGEEVHKILSQESLEFISKDQEDGEMESDKTE